MFAISKIATFILLPPGIFVVLIVLAVTLLYRGRKKAGLALGLSTAALLYALSTAFVAEALIRPLEDRYAPIDTSKAELDARIAAFKGAPVVVLGGGTIDRSPEEGGRASLAAEPTKRFTYGIRVAKALGGELVYSGGRVYDGPEIETEADAAGRFLKVNDAGLEAILEGESRTTLENARFVREKLGAKAVILVTSAYHMPRSVQAFRKAGLEVLPAPTDYKASRSPRVFVDFLPSVGALKDSYWALHEYLGMVGYSLAR